MTKPLKPGQLCTINKKLYRAKKEIVPGTCMGCDLVRIRQQSVHALCINSCLKYDIILQEVKIKKEKLHTQS